MSRRYETSIEIKAPVEAIWKALTEAAELARWFPLEAKVRPEVGGEIWLSWGPWWEGASRIEVWEPDRRLRTVAYPPAGAETTGLGQSAQPQAEGAAAMAVEYVLEAKGGSTVLRLVHSGFGEGRDWDDEYDGVSRGWTFELESLRQYLERHRGTDRPVAFAHRALAGLAPQDAWRRLTGPEGIFEGGLAAGLSGGASFTAGTIGGDRLEGRVVVMAPPRQLVAILENWKGGLFRLELEKCAGEWQAVLWLAAWGSPAGQVSRLGHRWQEMLDRLLPAAD